MLRNLVLLATIGVMLVPALAQAFAVEEDSTDNQLWVRIRNLSPTDTLSNVSVAAALPSFCSDATPVQIPATVPANDSEIAILEFDVLAGVAIGSSGNSVLTVSGTVAGQPVSSAILVPLVVEDEAPPTQGPDGELVPGLRPAMLVALVFVMVIAFAWAMRRARPGTASWTVLLLSALLSSMVARPALAAGSPTIIQVIVEVAPPTGDPPVAPAVTEFKPTFVTNFLRDHPSIPILDGDPTTNTYAAFLEWGLLTPGSVDFTVDGLNPKVGSAANPSLTMYDIETELSVPSSQVTVVATAFEGDVSPAVTIDQGLAVVPTWFAALHAATGRTLSLVPKGPGPFDRYISYESNGGQWPNPGYAIKDSSELPSFLAPLRPGAAALEFELKETFVTFDDVRISSLGPGTIAARGNTGFKVNLTVFEVSQDLEASLSGVLDLRPGELAVSSLTLSGQMTNTIERSLTVGRLPGMKRLVTKLKTATTGKPGLSRIAEAFARQLRRLGVTLRAVQSSTLSGTLAESDPGLLSSGLDFSAATFTYNIAGSANYTLNLFRDRVTAETSITLNPILTLTHSSSAGTSFADKFGTNAVLRFLASVGFKMSNLFQCRSGGGAYVNVSRPPAGSVSITGNFIDSVTEFGCQLSETLNNWWNAISNAWIWVASLWPFSDHPTAEVTIAEQIIPGSGMSLDILNANSGVLVFDMFDNATLGMTGVGEEIYGAYWNGTAFVGPTKITSSAMNQDSGPVVRFDATGDALAVWEHIGAAIPTTPDFGTAFTSTYELYYSALDTTTETWSAPVSLTSNSILDHSPALALLGSSLLTVWLSNSANVLPGDSTDPDTLNYSLWNGTTFSAAQAAFSVPSIEDMDLAASSTEALVVYVRDNSVFDFDDFTVTNEFDQEIMYSFYDGISWATPAQMTSDMKTDLAPRVAYDSSGVPVVVWVEETVTTEMRDVGGGEMIEVEISTFNLLASNFEIGAWTTPRTLVANSSILDHDVRYDSTDNLMVVWEESEDESTSLRYIVENAARTVITPIRSLTTGTESHDLKDLAVLGDIIYAGYGKAQVLQESELMDNVFLGEQEEVAFNRSGPTTLALLAHHVFTDVSITPQDVVFSDLDPILGQIVDIDVTVTNAGDLEVTNVEVEVREDVSQLVIGTPVISSIAPGDTGIASVQWTFPSGVGPHDVAVTVDPQNLIAEWYENNNEVVVSSSSPDLLVSDSTVLWPGSGLLTVRATVTNSGGQAAANVVSVVRDQAVVLAADTIVFLDAGDSATVDLTFNQSDLPIGVTEVVIEVDPMDSVLELDEANNTRTQIVRVTL